MEIENEFKFVLDAAAWPLDPKEATSQSLILQGVLARGRSAYTRVRREVLYAHNREQYSLATKVTLATGSNLEYPTPLTVEEYHTLWELAGETVVKIRYDLHREGFILDAYLESEGPGVAPYILLAEVECAPGASCPSVLPPLVEKHCLYRVNQGDTRFSSRNLFDPPKVRALVASLRSVGCEPIRRG